MAILKGGTGGASNRSTRTITMKNVKIQVNGVSVTCYEDGSVEKVDGRTGDLSRTFGSADHKGYRTFGVAKKMFKVHRLIARAFISEYTEELQVDHINAIKFDNRVENLRMLTNYQQSRAGRMPRSGGDSIYRGVCINKPKGRWSAQITIDRRKKNLGYFHDERDAAIAYDCAAILAGFSREALNFQ